MLAVPKRLRPYFLYDRKLLGELSRVAARTVTSFIRATVGEKDLSVGIVSSIQTHGSLANWHPHLHMLVTDGGFRPDGTFVHMPLHDVATLTIREAKKRWAELLRRIFEVDPLACPRCGEEMRIISFITEPNMIDRVLEHLTGRTQASRRHQRAPPRRWKSAASATPA